MIFHGPILWWILASIIFVLVAVVLQLLQRPHPAAVRRGDTAWAYFYLTLGFALAIEASVVALITPLRWPTNLVAYAALSLFTVYLWLNGWFQNKLLGWKARYEQRETDTDARPILGCAILLVTLAWVAAWSVLIQQSHPIP